MKDVRSVVIPREFIRPGLVWGRADGKLYVYVTRRSDSTGLPDAIEGVPVVVKVIGSVRPAAC